jgi:hypothetical protein
VSARWTAGLVAFGLLSAGGGGAAGGQAAIVCCNVPVNVDEEWIGTDHSLDCAAYLEGQSAEGRDAICRQLRAGAAICPAVAAYCEEAPAPTCGPPCTGDDWSNVPEEHRADALPSGERLVGGVAEAFQDAGVEAFGPHFSVRLDVNGCPMPNVACTYEAISRGNIPEGSLEGASQML